MELVERLDKIRRENSIDGGICWEALFRPRRFRDRIGDACERIAEEYAKDSHDKYELAAVFFAYVFRKRD